MNRAKLSQKFQFRNAEISFNNFERVRPNGEKNNNFETATQTLRKRIKNE
jgi:hypothetical protein